MKNSRFTVATHILSILSFHDALMPDDLVKSHQMAESVNTSPIVIRRILGTLRAAGLVEVQGGAAGGARLARNPDQISLREVYLAVETDDLFRMHPNAPSSTCPVGSTIGPILAEIYDEVDLALENVLKGVTIGDLYRKMRTNHPTGADQGAAMGQD